MGKWEEVGLGNVTEFQMGQAPLGRDCNKEGNGYPFVKVGQFGDKFPEINEWTTNPIKKVNKDYILICVVGATVGKLNYGINCAIGRSVAGILPIREKLNQSFLFYYLNTWIQKLRDGSRGSAQGTITKQDLNNLPIPLPPLPEQQRIVIKLDDLFAKIDQAIGLLEENILHTQALMGSVLDEEFGKLMKSDFEPFLNAVFIQNKTLVPNDKETYNYVGLENIESNTGKLVSFSKTLGDTIKSSKVYFEKEDVLYGKLRPYLNKVWVSNFSGVSTTEILPFKVKQEKLLPKYLAYYLRSNTFLNVVNANTSGARMPRASARFFKDTATVPKVEIKHQQEIILKFDKLFNHFENIIQTQTQKLNHLKALKSSLLDQAFKGEL